MSRVTGVGGVFLRARDPKALMAWYCIHLGVEPSGAVGVNFVWKDCEPPEAEGMTVFSFFPADTRYFGPGHQPAMINFRVDDLDGLLAKLEKAGVRVEPQREEQEYGRFAWILDLEGNRVELWEPATVAKSQAA